MSNFASYIIAAFLTHLGWPHKSGFFGRKTIVDCKVVDSVIYQLIRLGVGIGVGRPQLAVRLIADAFVDRDWSGEGSVATLLQDIQMDRINDRAAKTPWGRIAPPKLERLGRTSIPWDWLGTHELAVHYLGAFTQGVLWGFLNPEDGQEAFGNERLEYQEKAPFFREAGLNISPTTWEEHEEFYQSCENLVRDFERSRRPLSEPPPELLSDPLVAKRLALKC